MKIIDAHLHLFSEDSAEEMARQVGHHNNVDHLRRSMENCTLPTAW